MSAKTNKVEETMLEFDLFKLICDENVDCGKFNEDVYVNAPSFENIIYHEQSKLQNIYLSESIRGFDSINLDSLSLESETSTTTTDCTPTTFIENNRQINSNDASLFLLRKDPLGAIVRVPVSDSYSIDSSSSTVEDPEEEPFADCSTKTKLQLAILNRCIAEGKDITKILHDSPKIETMPTEIEVAKENDRKERNRQSAKKSRESKKAEYDQLKQKNKELVQINETEKKAVQILEKKAKTLKDFIIIIKSQESQKKFLEEFSNTHNLHPHINQESGDDTYLDIQLPAETVFSDLQAASGQDQRNTTVSFIKSYPFNNSLSTPHQQDICLSKILYEFPEETQPYLQLETEQQHYFPHNYQNPDSEIHQEPQQVPHETRNNTCGYSSQLPVSDSIDLSQPIYFDSIYPAHLTVSNTGYSTQLAASDTENTTQPAASYTEYSTQLAASGSENSTQSAVSDIGYSTQPAVSDIGYSTQPAASGTENSTQLAASNTEYSTQLADFRCTTQLAVSESNYSQGLTYSNQGDTIPTTTYSDIELNVTKHVTTCTSNSSKSLKSYDNKKYLGIWQVDSSGSDDEIKTLVDSFIEEPTVKKMKLDGDT
ncbi:hypothetical protein Btru_071386 [Bulinus truncatus]|nr:hypothetical protein Btru_071386 [Bulinus truncatus]